jgi:hypothetical protein
MPMRPTTATAAKTDATTSATNMILVAICRFANIAKGDRSPYREPAARHPAADLRLLSSFAPMPVTAPLPTPCLPLARLIGSGAGESSDCTSSAVGEPARMRTVILLNGDKSGVLRLDGRAGPRRGSRCYGGGVSDGCTRQEHTTDARRVGVRAHTGRWVREAAGTGWRHKRRLRSVLRLPGASGHEGDNVLTGARR